MIQQSKVTVHDIHRFLQVLLNTVAIHFVYLLNLKRYK